MSQSAGRRRVAFLAPCSRQGSVRQAFLQLRLQPDRRTMLRQQIGKSFRRQLLERPSPLLSKQIDRSPDVVLELHTLADHVYASGNRGIVHPFAGEVELLMRASILLALASTVLPAVTAVAQTPIPPGGYGYGYSFEPAPTPRGAGRAGAGRTTTGRVCRQLCAADVTPCDPPEYKIADGRCQDPMWQY